LKEKVSFPYFRKIIFRLPIIGQSIRDKTDSTVVQNDENMTEKQVRRDKRAGDKNAGTGQLGKDSWERTAGKGQLGPDSWDKKAVRGHLGQYR
jgi:hypothetical protein